MDDVDAAAFARALGSEIAHWRRRRDLSRDELAGRIGSSGTTVGRYERGETSPDMVETWQIVRALDVDFEVFIRRVVESLRPGGNAGSIEAQVQRELLGRSRPRSTQDDETASDNDGAKNAG